MNILDAASRQGQEGAQVERLAGIPDVQEVVGSLTPFCRAGFGGAYIHSPVDLPAIGIDDFALEHLG
jgi:hypothetical protein